MATQCIFVFQNNVFVPLMHAQRYNGRPQVDDFNGIANFNPEIQYMKINHGNP